MRLNPSATVLALVLGAFATPSLAAEPTSFPAGTYRVGDMQVHIHPDGSLMTTLAADGTTYSRGAWSSTGDTLRVKEDWYLYDSNAPCIDVEGTYRWRETGDAYRLDVIDDACSGRAAAVLDRDLIRED